MNPQSSEMNVRNNRFVTGVLLTFDSAGIPDQHSRARSTLTMSNSPFEKGGSRGICFMHRFEIPPCPPFYKGGNSKFNQENTLFLTTEKFLRRQFPVVVT